MTRDDGTNIGVASRRQIANAGASGLVLRRREDHDAISASFKFQVGTPPRRLSVLRGISLFGWGHLSAPALRKRLAAALGIASPWYVRNVAFDGGKRLLTISIDFAKGSRFPYPGVDGQHPVHDTVPKRYRHLNFFQHECYLEVRTPRIKLPDGRVVLAEPDWAGKLSGFTLLFEALILARSEHLSFAINAHSCAGRCPSPPSLAWPARAGIGARQFASALWTLPWPRRTAAADLSHVTRLAIDETSQAGAAMII